MKILVVYIFLLLGANVAWARSLSDLNLLVDDSLRIPMREMVQQYVRANYMSVGVQFGNYVGLLDFNHEDNDIIITANENHFNLLKTNDLVEKDIIYIANDPLLMFFPPDLKSEVSTDIGKFLKRIGKRTNVVIVDPNNAISGYLAHYLLSSLDVTNLTRVQDDEKARYLIKNSKAVGILTGSSANELKNYLKIPEELYEPLRYHVIVLKGKSSERTNSFLKFLLLNKKIFRKYGINTNN